MSLSELTKKINLYLKNKDYSAIAILLESEKHLIPKNFRTFDFYQKLANKNKSSFDFKFDLDCVCLNTTNHELKKIESLFQVWLKWHLKRGGEECYFSNLVIALDQMCDPQIKTSIDMLIEKYRVNKIFKSIFYLDAGVPDSYNFYYRNVDGTLDLTKCIYGYKSGPNYQFFAVIKKLINLGYRNVYLCETDTYPTNSNWCNELFLQAETSETFWILGSPFWGRSKIDPSLALHINGSAIYSVQAAGFSHFLAEWETKLLELVPEIPYVAFDWVWDYYFYNRISAKNWEKLSDLDFHAQLTFKKMCRYTDRIINLAGEAERAGVGRYDFHSLNVLFPNISIVHADYFLKNYIEDL